MSLRIRCPNCRRSMSGRHSLCADCRASSSTQTTVYVVESGARVEVITDRLSRSRSSTFRHVEPRSNYSSVESYRDAGRYLERHERGIDRDISNGYSYVDAYGRDAEQYHETLGATYARPRVHPYSDRYEYVSADNPSHGGPYPGVAQRQNTSSWQSGYQQYHSEGYHQPSQARTQQAHGQESQVEYVYSGTEGPDGEIID